MNEILQVLGFVFLASFSIWGLLSCGEEMGRNEIKKEAVRRGYGKFVIIDTEDGESEFKWNDEV